MNNKKKNEGQTDFSYYGLYPLGPNLTARSSAHHGIVQLVCGRRKASNAEYDMICDAS